MPNHEVTGTNFHGPYRIVLRGPEVPFLLSESQGRRYEHELCPFSDCTCGGGYGDGPDGDTARVWQVWQEGIPPCVKEACDGFGTAEMEEYVLVPSAWYEEHREEIESY